MVETVGNEILRNHWSIHFDEMEFIYEHPSSAWLDIAIKLRHYKAFGFFPSYIDVPTDVIEHVASQLGPNVDTKWILTKERTDRRRKSAF